MNRINPKTNWPPRRRPRRPERRCEGGPVLRFTAAAWAKLHYFCHRGECEVGGFGQASAGDPLLVEDFLTVRQSVSPVSVAFDDAAVADLFEAQVDAGRKPDRFARIWLHTHPGDSPVPSSVDEETFSRVFGRCDWAVMFVLARGGRAYARLRFSTGPGGAMLIPVKVDYAAPFGAADHGAWEDEHRANVVPQAVAWGVGGPAAAPGEHPLTSAALLADAVAREPEERRLAFDELDASPWAQEPYCR